MWGDGYYNVYQYSDAFRSYFDNYCESSYNSEYGYYQYGTSYSRNVDYITGAGSEYNSDYGY